MDKEYLIQEKPLKALLIFAFPMIIGNLFQQFYTMVDSVVVGRFVSEHALAAVGASYSLTNVFISIAIGGGVGASVLTSRYFGSREYRKMKTSVTTAMLSFLVVSLILGGTGLFFGQEIMELLNTPENILEQATEYLNIYFLGLPFLFMYNILSAMFNALGRSKIPLYLLIFSSVFNIVLDVVFVREFHMGVAGVAWATLIAQGISAVVAFLLFVREMKQYQGEKGDTRFDKEEFSRMSRIALPSILQQSTVSIGMILCVILEFFYQPLIGMFLGEEGTALAMSTGTDYLRFIGWFFTFIGLKMITDGLLRGAGDMKMFTVANLVNLSIRVIMAVTLAPVFGIAMVWYAVPVGWAANYVISFLEYRTGKWRKKVK